MNNKDEWRDFNNGEWSYTIDVNDFIKKNYKSYTGGPEFLEGPTEKTKKLLKIYEDACNRYRYRNTCRD